LRTPLITANWKMHKTGAEAARTIEELRPLVADLRGAEVSVCAPFTALFLVAAACKGSNIAWGAQDVYWEEQGAFTGEVSPLMLTDLGCTQVIVGHSERRARFGKADPKMTDALLRVFGDNDETVNRKAQAVIKHGLTPIICVGETIAERKSGKTDSVVSAQIEKALEGIGAEAVAKLVIAYEPVWAIGTGEFCDPPEANRVIGLIRSAVERSSGKLAAQGVRIQYGGSAKPDNIADFMARPEIDGALVGGASLEAASFGELCQSAARAAAARKR